MESHSFYSSVLKSRPYRRRSQKDRSDDNVYTPPAKVVVAHQDVTEYNDGWGRDLYLTSQFMPSRPKTKGPKTKKFGEYAILTKRRIGSDGRTIVGVDLEIQSLRLREKLMEIITIDYGIDLSKDPIVIPKPYHMLFFERQRIFGFAEEQGKAVTALEDELKEKAQETERSEEEAKEDEAKIEEQRQMAAEINLLADFITNDDDLTNTRTEFSQLEPHGMITFPILWTIFQPGQLVRVELEGKVECMRLKSFRLTYDDKGMPFYEVIGLGTEFDGSTVGESKKTVAMLPFAGTKRIAKLPVVPEKHWPNFEEAKATLVERGRKWCRLLGRPKHMQYEDICFSQHPAPKLLSIHERVMIDPIAYYEEHVSDRPILEKPDEDAKKSNFVYLREQREEADSDDEQSDYGYDSDIIVIPRKPPAWRSKKITETVILFPKLTDDLFLRCPAIIPGFALRSKIWAYFKVDDAFLGQIRWNKTAFRTLQMHEYKKKLVKSLIDGHEASTGFDDLVSGKGQGLIFLLYGPPGLGKTLTAETISEHTQRPLYVVSSGELTTSVKQMECELSRIFKMGHRWNAVVLLDEADVLMSKRSGEALEKNAIVSVFLRCLEYYRGVLFLTTNRLGDFDDAILNRIHLLLQFGGLSAEMRKGIWKTLLQANSKHVPLDHAAWTEEAYELLGKFNVNGRTIKNFLQTAALNAKAQSQSLAPIHLFPIMMTNLNCTLADDEEVKELLVEFGKHLKVEMNEGDFIDL